MTPRSSPRKTVTNRRKRMMKAVIGKSSSSCISPNNLLSRCGRQRFACDRRRKRWHGEIRKAPQPVQKVELKCQVLQRYGDRRHRPCAAPGIAEPGLVIDDPDVRRGDPRKNVAHAGSVVGRRIKA